MAGLMGAGLGYGLGNLVKFYADTKYRTKQMELEEQRDLREKRNQEAQEFKEGLLYDQPKGGAQSKELPSEGLLATGGTPSVSNVGGTQVPTAGMMTAKTESPQPGLINPQSGSAHFSYSPWKQKQMDAQQKASELSLAKHDPDSDLSRNVHQFSRKLWNQGDPGLGDSLFGPNPMSAAEIEMMLPHAEKYNASAAQQVRATLDALRVQSNIEGKEKDREFRSTSLDETKRHHVTLEGLAKEKAAKEKQPTTAQFQAAGYAKRIEQSEQDFKNVLGGGYDPTSKQSILYRNTPEVLRGFLPEGAQLQDQAERNFVNAVLRRESGAAISQGEFRNAEKQYFPRAGDTPAVLKQKAVNRRIVLNNLKAEAAPAYNKSPSIEEASGSVSDYSPQKKKSKQAPAPGGLIKGNKKSVDQMSRQELIEFLGNK